nr:hypothetical protein BgiMline_010364 [Biomphalaria glabrata]
MKDRRHVLHTTCFAHETLICRRERLWACDNCSRIENVISFRKRSVKTKYTAAGVCVKGCFTTDVSSGQKFSLANDVVLGDQRESIPSNNSDTDLGRGGYLFLHRREAP